EAYGLPGRVAVGELDLDALIDSAPLIGPKPDFSAFPVAKEDFAFIVDEAVSAGELQAVVAGASPLLESARLFDVYTGDQVGEGRKSLAFKVRLRAQDRTLTDADIKAARDQIVAAAATLGAQLR